MLLHLRFFPANGFPHQFARACYAKFLLRSRNIHLHRLDGETEFLRDGRSTRSLSQHLKYLQLPIAQLERLADCPGGVQPPDQCVQPFLLEVRKQGGFVIPKSILPLAIIDGSLEAGRFG